MNISKIKRVAWVLDELRPIAKSLHTLDENACNYGLTKRQETRETNLMKKAEELARELGLHAYHQGDPRGGTLYLIDNKTRKDEQYTNGVFVA